MQITFTRMVISLVGITFGFFIGCTTPSSTTQEPLNTDALSKQQLENELQTINRQIDAGTTDADTYYQKAYLLSEYAQKLGQPAERTPSYMDMHSTLKRAQDLYTNMNRAAGQQQVDELLKVTWSNEHNLGVQIMQSDSTLDGKDFEKAAVHFKNATVILPDTAISYKMEARAYYQNHKPELAIEALEEARNHIDRLPSDMLEQLAFLYQETEQPQKAVAVYEAAESFSDENLNIIHGLANAYISAEEHDKAVELLERLVENEPENIVYAHSLATEYYYLGSIKLRTMMNSADDFNQLPEAHLMFEKAEKQFTNALELSSGNNEIQLAFAKFYQNVSAQYQKVLPEVDNEQREQLKVRISNYLTSSIPLFERLVRQDPDSTTLWSNLYQVYTYLGMSEKAEEAKSNIN